jgi:hypothetical protein
MRTVFRRNPARRFLAVLLPLAAAALGAFVACSARADETVWFVIMGSFKQGAVEAEDLAYAASNNCGLAASIGDGFDYVGITPDVTFVYLGPFATKGEASALLSEARRCVPDAYVKSATPRPAH